MADLALATDLAIRTGRSATDPLLLLALRRASDRFRGDVGHPVSLVTDDSVVLNGDGSILLLLPAAPVISVSEVEVDGEPVTDWEIADDGRLRRWCGWPNKYRSVAVTYTHGYATIPPDIADAVLDAAEGDMNANLGVTSMAVGGESVTFASRASGVLQSWTTAVDRYRIGRDRP